MTVKLSWHCMSKVWPPTSNSTLPIPKNPQLPVENFLGTAWTFFPVTSTLMALAAFINSFRVIADACRSLAPERGFPELSPVASSSRGRLEDFSFPLLDLLSFFDCFEASASTSASAPPSSSPVASSASSAASSCASWIRAISAATRSLSFSLQPSRDPGLSRNRRSSSARTSLRDALVRSAPRSTSLISPCNSASVGVLLLTAIPASIATGAARGAAGLRG
mmetsp:Transcript_23759/g.64665  ORF Transcript_23759/g.64665 Transcript_23759/m.64665 type:complete len:222 (+) Transcript_23759:101-766(+)